MMKAQRKEPTPAGGPRVLVVEDEADLQELLCFNLSRHGYRASSCDSGELALRMVRSDAPDLVLLDLMLPGMEGLDVCRALKNEPSTSHIPIVMLTARSEEADIVIGLELGADDYVTKPFSPRVLLARVKAVLRRKAQPAERAPAANGNAPIHHRDIIIRPERHEVLVGGEPIELTATEFRVLYLLMSHPGRVFTRKQIIDSVHGGLSAVTERSVDVQMVLLRRKLGPHGSEVATVRGVGYRFKE